MLTIIQGLGKPAKFSIRHDCQSKFGSTDTDQTDQLPDGFLAGELVLGLEGGKQLTLPIRVGIETGEWDSDALSLLGKINHQPTNALSFPAYLPSIGRGFKGHKYVAHYNIAKSGTDSLVVTSVGVRSFLPSTELTIEEISLINETGHAVSLAALLQRNELALAFRSHTALMWENLDVLSRAFMVHAAETIEDGQTLARMEQPSFHPDQVVLLADGQGMNVQNGTVPTDGKDQVTISDYEPERVEVKVHAASPGYLVLADSWYPGWNASVDGQSTPIYRADYIFRAVRLATGQHTVVFDYHPSSFVWGATISGLGVTVCALLAIVSFYGGRRGTQERDVSVSA